MAIKFVKNLYSSRPLLANSISGFLIFSFGDVISQFIPPFAAASSGKRMSYEAILDAYKSTEVSVIRAVSFGLLGMAENGLILHYWYRAMEKYIGTSMTSPKVILGKIIVDQVVYAPGSILIYFGYTAALGPFFGGNQGHGHGHEKIDSNERQCRAETVTIAASTPTPKSQHSLSSAIDSFLFKAQHHFVNTYLADFLVWPATNFINFKYIPINYRPTFMGIMCVFWQSYLSFVSNQPDQEE